MTARRRLRVPAEDLTEVQLRAMPVWEFCNDDEAGETLMEPVQELPISHARRRVVACEFTLADGTKAFGQIGNLSLQREEQNRHFLGISLFVQGKLVHLARYHDAWYATENPAHLAAKLDRKLEAVFPISYDLSAIAEGNPQCVRGTIPQEPIVRLGDDELIRLALE